jgi:putative ABC transport system substrate-binding protein
MPVIGVLWHAGSPDEEQPFFDALQKGFNDLGYVEGQNIRLEHRFPNEVPDRFRAMISELVAMPVQVLVSMAPASNYVRDAAVAVPHVFAMVSDPVAQNFVDSLARPGRNATGLSQLAFGIARKRFQLLHEALGGASSIGLLVDPSIATTASIFKEEAQTAAAEAGLTLKLFEASSVEMLGAAFEEMRRVGLKALRINGSGFLYQQRATIADLALSGRVPIAVWAREAMEPNAFMSYGASLAAMVRRAPIYVDRILKGAKPADLPVEQPTKFELIINLGVAKKLGIDVPPMLLAQADEVIE